MWIESYQLYKEDTKIDYFKEVWSYVDLAPPVLNIALIISFHLDMSVTRTSTFEVVLQGTCSFSMWLKTLYFLRIFSSFSYLIRMIIMVVADMGPFLTVLLFAMIAFADAFYAISKASGAPDIPNFTMSVIYIYNMCLGAYENDYGDLAPTFGYILFIACTLFNMIVMFNLLIAIISETFAKVNENAEQAGYQERAALINENLFLIPKAYKESNFSKNTLLFQALNMDTDFVNEGDDQVAESLNNIKDMLESL